MPILIAGRERCVLKAGTNVLGGVGTDAVDISDLASLPRVAVITIAGDGTVLIQRLSSRIVVKLAGETLGAVPRELRDGAEIEVGGLRLGYDAATSEAGAAPSPTPKASELATEVLPAVSAPGRPARLVELTTGTVISIAAREMTVGRSEECDLVLSGKGLSRRHALIRADGSSYVVSDESTNGTFVNGERVTGRRALVPGDIVAFGEAQYRFEFVEPAEASRRAPDATAVARGVQAPAPVLAELEITEGPGAGTVHRLTRSVCSIGRGRQNDVHVAHESVSTSHASLLLKGDTWCLTDLHSANGTYVDGYRVAGERVLSAGCSLRLGKVEMTFRPVGRVAVVANGTRVVEDGLLRRIARVLAPPRD